MRLLLVVCFFSWGQTFASVDHESFSSPRHNSVRSPQRSPGPTRRPPWTGATRLYSASFYLTKGATINVTATLDGVEYQNQVRGFVFRHQPVISTSHTGKIFSNLASMKTYLQQHVCLLQPSGESMVSFRAPRNTRGLYSTKIELGKGNFSTTQKRVNVGYFRVTPEGNGTSVYHDTITCP